MSHEQDSTLVTSNREHNQTQQAQYPPPSQSTKRISSSAHSCADQQSDQLKSIESNQSSATTATSITSTTTKCVVRKQSLNKSTKHSNKDDENQSPDKPDTNVFGEAGDYNDKTVPSNKNKPELRNRMCKNDVDAQQQQTTTTTTTMSDVRTASVDDNNENSSIISTVKNVNTNGVNGPDTSPNEQDQKQTKSCNKCCFCWCCCSFLTVKKNEENCGKSKDPNRLEVLNGDSEPLPSLEEIRDWGESFEKLMKCSVGRDIFREFLKGEYSEENIMFWLACEELKKETNPETIEEKARVIYEDFISILSPKEVSLDARVRDIINRKMMEPMPHTFDEAQLQIYTLMHRDSYPRFVNSTVYRKLAQLPVPSRKGSVA